MIPITIHRFEEVGSTNEIALDMARAGEPEGTVVLAKSQTAGRGRRGRTWLDEPGTSILMSVVLRPEMPLDRLPELSFVASVAVADYLKRDFGIKPALKWPNDVLVGGRKIAGVLVETTGSAAVVGIGLNLNQVKLAKEIAGTATSVAIETGTAREVDAAARSLAEALLAGYETYLAHGFEEILTRWRKYMWGVGRQATVETEGVVLRGMILAVDSSGALWLRDPSGEVHVIHAADSFNLVTL